MSFSVNNGDMAGRMRKWEPCMLGPIYPDAYDFDTWAELNYSEPIVIKGNKSPECGNKIDTVG